MKDSEVKADETISVGTPLIVVLSRPGTVAVAVAVAVVKIVTVPSLGL